MLYISYRHESVFIYTSPTVTSSHMMERFDISIFFIIFYETHTISQEENKKLTAFFHTYKNLANAITDTDNHCPSCCVHKSTDCLYQTRIIVNILFIFLSIKAHFTFGRHRTSLCQSCFRIVEKQ